MKTAAIYCRVSGDSQERDGTSLQTQLDACKKYCQEKGYEVAQAFSETYSGLTLERPKLSQMRDIARNGEIEVVVVYCLDRLSRDPTHGVIITQGFEQNHVKLEAVTEDLNNSELGKLINYVRGFASKLEAEKIKERTQRGKRAKAKAGCMVGGFHITYGYDYVRLIRGERQARRLVNETEARWVKQMFAWLVDDGMSSFAIAGKLNELGVPTKHGRRWTGSNVRSILHNPSYCGKTYAFARIRRQNRRRPRDEWIEIPGDLTPVIVSPEVFEAAQKQLYVNYERCKRNNTRHQYLLRGHIKCRECGHAYVGAAVARNSLSCRRYKRYYHCSGRWQKNSLPNHCRNTTCGSDELEALIWGKLEEFLQRPELITAEIEKQNQTTYGVNAIEAQLQDVERQLKTVERDQRHLLRLALKGFPDNQVEAENRRLNEARQALMVQKAELEKENEACQGSLAHMPKVEQFIERIQTKISTLDFEGKREVLDMLGIQVSLHHENIEITGIVPMEDVAPLQPNPPVGIVTNCLGSSLRCDTRSWLGDHRRPGHRCGCRPSRPGWGDGRRAELCGR
jgi:site-specific DNA recombinase